MKISCLLIAFIPFLTFSQTKLIFHKSHSGSAASFHRTLVGNPSNFGVAPVRRIEHAVLDTLKYLPDGRVVMVTSEYCTFEDYGRYDKEAEQKAPKNFDKQTAELWRAGTDTLVNHALFSRRHELNNIKDSLERHYFFRNPVNTVVFVGYDNLWTKYRKKVERRKKGALPAIGNRFPDETPLLPLAVVSALLLGRLMTSLRRKVV